MADTTHPDPDTLSPSDDPAAGRPPVEPPRAFLSTLRQLGPGLIIAGSIVGSGELIATTKTGAQAGISLLWLIIIGCLIKVFVQIELGRFSITHGETTLAALNSVPGPRGLGQNWILWFWWVMMLAGLAQLGGIVGGVGQALAISYPITGDYAAAIQRPSSRELWQYLAWDDALLTEWDLQVYSDRDFAPPFQTTGFGLGPEALLARRRHVANQTRARLDALQAAQPGARDQLLAAFDALRQTEAEFRNSPADRRSESLKRAEDARRALQARLADANQAPFLAAIDALPSEEERTAAAANRQRIERGHAILAARLRALDLDTPPLATAAVVASLNAREAGKRLEGFRRELPPAADASPAAALEMALHATEAASRNRIVSTLLEPPSRDDKYWAGLVTLATVVLLYFGRYGLIQHVSTALVVLFTFITLGNVFELQRTPQWQVSTADFLRGLSFGLPEGSGLKTALATFGIIGVGASELITYPYWCIEKGYARFAGPRTPDERWAQRARGWMRVMHYDAFLSMVIYTFATLAFFLMGVAVLFNEGRDPDGMRMVSTLATAYVPVFGEHAKWLFLIGAIAVLYSTFLVANAGHARTYTDALKLLGIVKKHDEAAHQRSVTTFGVALPLISFALYWSGINPVTAVLLGGLMQAAMLPMLGFAALYFRRTATDPRLAPGKLWDAMLLVSCLGLLVAGVWGVVSHVF